MPALANAAALSRLAVVAAILALVGLLGVRPAVDADGLGARAMGPLPACRYDDILTSPRGYDDWDVTLVDTILRLPKTYAPPDLVKVSSLGVPGKGQVRAVMAEDLKAMSDAAVEAGNPIGVHSPYRSYATQVIVFNRWVDVHGYKRALQLSARPGHSEHQLGLAVDFRSDPPVATLAASWGTTPAGKWMRNHAWEYGFVMSYPKGKMSLVCYDYEPWHFRYVGREVAAQIHASGLTPRQYLWRHFTTTVVPKVTPKPTAKATPRPAATRTPAPTTAPSPTVVPTVSASAAPTLAPIVTSAPATLAPPSAPPTAAAPASVPPAPPQAPGSFDPATVSSVAIGGAALALGTIVLGGALLLRRRGRSGVGL
jgi:LAS superfamily LD-carboxypeptidase LdcB